jgi:Organic solute transporter Ostalpha
MGGIISHLSNYNQPNVQCYIVRILWMVPIYSIESWLCLRFHRYAIYIETLRDFYESYVLYSFVQFLIQVMGGEEALILMLKDKSPTRGVHMWGMQWCIKPWLMGQPVRKTYETIVMPTPSSSHTMKRQQQQNSGKHNKHHHHNPTKPLLLADDGINSSSNNKATRRMNSINTMSSTTDTPSAATSPTTR